MPGEFSVAERDQELPTEPVPVNSKRDLPLVTAEPMSDAGGASVIKYLRNGNKMLCNSHEREE